MPLPATVTNLVPRHTCFLARLRAFTVCQQQGRFQASRGQSRATYNRSLQCHAAAAAAPPVPAAEKAKGKAQKQDPLKAWEAIVGIECHIQLNTRTKAFCNCSNQFGAPVNQHVCPVCLAHPGALPVLNHEMVRKAVLAGLALNCQISGRSKFDRKQYFYPDLPKGYQISQYDIPLAFSGKLELLLNDGTQREVEIQRAHLEEDAGKLVHGGTDAAEGSSHSLVDYNRAGVPLLEVVSGPDLRSGREAAAYAAELRRIMTFMDIGDSNTQNDASMRCDVNVSVRRKGEQQLRTRVEVKNMNSLSAIQKAVEFELSRQVALIEEGREHEIVQETRLFDEAKGTTFSMRKKEGLADYRYFPEPDLPPLHIDDAEIIDLEGGMPEMPAAKRQRYLGMKLAPKDVLTLTDDMATAHYFDAVLAAGASLKPAANWVMGDLMAHCKESKTSFAELGLQPGTLAEMIALIDGGTISGKIGKQILPDLLKGEGGDGLEQWVQSKGLAQISDEAAIAAMIDGVLAQCPKELEQYRAGKTKLQGHFTGLVMKESKGRVNPGVMNKILMQRLQQSA